MPDPKAFEAMNAFHEQMHAAGVLLAAEGLHPTSKGAMVKVSRGRVKVTDGPFTEAKEIIAGFTMIQVKSREEALEWVRRFPAALGPEADADIEVRQLYDADDFAEQLTPEAQAREAEWRGELAAKK